MSMLAAATNIDNSPILIPSLLASVCTIGYFVSFWQLADTWQLRARIVGGAFAGFIVVSGLGGARGGNLNHVLFLYSDLMIFFAIYGFSETYARQKRKYSGMSSQSMDVWRATFRRQRFIGAMVISGAVLAAGYLPIW
jgi:hypothetical protein